jgi:hydroxyacylglutathione hydrolase
VSTAGVETVARRYADAFATADDEAIAAAWAEGGTPRIIGLAPFADPGDFIGFIGDVRAGCPDLSLELLELHTTDEGAVLVWRATGTFGGGSAVRGLAPTGRGVDLELCDILRLRDGKIRRSNLVLDCSELASQLGGLPELIADPEPERVADGVWLLRGGYPVRSMNAYLIEDDGLVTIYDTGTRAMAPSLARAAEARGGIRRVILGHSHSDHRGSAAALGAPVFCHVAEKDDAEGDGGLHYMDMDKIAVPAGWVMASLMRAYDGPAPTIAGTLSEGDEVAGFTVVHLPGHAPGLIGLWREVDRLALVSDAFYLTDVDALGRPAPARVPHPGTSLDIEQAADSIRKLAALEPDAAWPGHLGPVTGDVRGQLERAT